MHSRLLFIFDSFFGGIVETPCDMVNVRKQNDIKLQKHFRRKYVIIYKLGSDGSRVPLY